MPMVRLTGLQGYGGQVPPPNRSRPARAAGVVSRVSATLGPWRSFCCSSGWSSGPRRLVSVAGSRGAAADAEARCCASGWPSPTRRGDRAQDVAVTVAPLREALGKVESHLRELEHARVGAYAALSEQVGLRALGRRGAARPDRLAGDGAARAAGPRPLGRDAAAPGRRAGRHGRALRLHRAGDRDRRRRRPAGPTSWCGWPAASRWSSTRRSRSPPTSTPPSRATPTRSRPGWPPTPATCAST